MSDDSVMMENEEATFVENEQHEENRGEDLTNEETDAKSRLKSRSLAAGQVDRVVAAALPDGMHVSKEARIALQKTATLSILYLSCLAEDERARESKKRITLSVNDIKAALKAAGMGHLLPMISVPQIKRTRGQDDHV